MIVMHFGLDKCTKVTFIRRDIAKPEYGTLDLDTTIKELDVTPNHTE